jgi:hypothetical protein
VKMQGTLGAIVKHGGEKGENGIFGTFGPIICANAPKTLGPIILGQE